MKGEARVGSAVVGGTLLAPIAWGTTYVVISELLPGGRPLLIATMRLLPAALVLLLAVARPAHWRPRGREWWRTGLLAGCNFGVFFPLLAVAVDRLPGGVAAAVGGVQPLLVAAFSRVGGLGVRTRDLVVGVVAAVGVALVVVGPSTSLDAVGVLAALGANVSFAVGVVLTKRFPAPSHRVAATGWQLLLGGVVLLPLTLAVEGRPPVPSVANIVGFGYLSTIGTALAFVLWFNGIRRLPTFAPPLLGLAAPITGAAIGWLVLGEALSFVQTVGFVTTIAAIFYGATLGSRSPAGGVAVAKLDRPVLRLSFGGSTASRRLGRRT